MKRNSSYNSYYVGLKPKDAIVKAVEKLDRAVSPYEISSETSLNHNTVKVYMRQLLKDGKLFQPFSGHYTFKIIDGVMGGGFRVHNLCLVGVCPWLRVKLADVVEFFGGVKVWVQFGVQRHRLTVKVCCDGGMDYDTVCFAVSRAFDVVYERTGRHFPEDVIVRTFEANRDFEGVRLDGVQCFTRKGFFDVLERLYQKDKATVRFEQKVSYPMSVSEFEAKFLELSRGGVASFNVNQAMFMLFQENRRLSESMKFMNEGLMRLSNLVSSLLEKLNNNG